MSPILIVVLALLVYAGFAILRARNRDEERTREIETEARFAAEADAISREAERQEMRDAATEQDRPRS
jgi:hypothetical protein